MCWEGSRLSKPEEPGLGGSRIIKALRVIRLFRRLKDANRIVTALLCGVIPVTNAFVILFVVTGVWHTFAMCERVRIRRRRRLLAVATLAVGIQSCRVTPAPTSPGRRESVRAR